MNKRSKSSEVDEGEPGRLYSVRSMLKLETDTAGSGRRSGTEPKTGTETGRAGTGEEKGHVKMADSRRIS